MIRACTDSDFEDILAIINDAATAYNGFVPDDCLSDPYMSDAELSHEIAQGVRFWGCEDAGQLVGVIGTQDVKDVTLIRHAYVRTSHRNRGLGDQLLRHLTRLTERPVLIGTWRDATWAIRFYEKRGFQLALGDQKDQLLSMYWSIPERQAEVSVVLRQ